MTPSVPLLLKSPNSLLGRSSVWHTPKSAFLVLHALFPSQCFVTFICEIPSPAQRMRSVADIAPYPTKLYAKPYHTTTHERRRFRVVAPPRCFVVCLWSSCRVETPVLRGHAVPPRVLEPTAGAFAAVPRTAPRQQRPDGRVARGQRELRPQARRADRWTTEVDVCTRQPPRALT